MEGQGGCWTWRPEQASGGQREGLSSNEDPVFTMLMCRSPCGRPLGDERGRKAWGDPLAACAPYMLIVHVTSDDATLIPVFTKQSLNLSKTQLLPPTALSRGRAGDSEAGKDSIYIAMG